MIRILCALLLLLTGCSSFNHAPDLNNADDWEMCVFDFGQQYCEQEKLAFNERNDTSLETEFNKIEEPKLVKRVPTRAVRKVK